MDEEAAVSRRRRKRRRKGRNVDTFDYSRMHWEVLAPAVEALKFDTSRVVNWDAFRKLEP